MKHDEFFDDDKKDIKVSFDFDSLEKYSRRQTWRSFRFFLFFVFVFFLILCFFAVLTALLK